MAYSHDTLLLSHFDYTIISTFRSMFEARSSSAFVFLPKPSLSSKKNILSLRLKFSFFVSLKLSSYSFMLFPGVPKEPPTLCDWFKVIGTFGERVRLKSKGGGIFRLGVRGDSINVLLSSAGVWG